MSLKFLNKTRGYSRATVTRLYNDRENFDSYDEVKKQTIRTKLTEIKSDLKDYDFKISSLLYDEDEDDGRADNEMHIQEEYNDKINECILVLTNKIVLPSVTSDGAKSLLKCPQAPLPVFKSEQGENFEVFLQNFEDTIGKFRYTDFDKFLLLKQQIKGKSLFLIESLDPARQTYAKAKEILTAALASRPLQVSNVLNQLTEIKMTYSTEPFEYMAIMQRIRQSFEKLVITTDEVLEHFYFKGMNETFRNQLVLVTNNSRPKLDDILGSFFLANERYGHAQALYKKSKGDYSNSNNQKFSNPNPRSSVKISSNAAETILNAKNPFNHCTLCDHDSHGINKCTRYQSASDKLSKLESINGCTKCTNTDHSSDKCRFRFRKACNICANWHFTFVCPDSNPNPYPSERKPSSSGKKQTHASMVINANCLRVGSNIDSALSTVTCMLQNGVKVKALRDSGSQNSLIPERFLTNCNHTVLENDIDLTVKGINEMKLYKSKLVKMNITIGNDVKSIEFLTMSDIAISLEFPSLASITKTFVKNGYSFTDTKLHTPSNYINNICVIQYTWKRFDMLLLMKKLYILEKILSMSKVNMEECWWVKFTGSPRVVAKANFPDQFRAISDESSLKLLFLHVTF